MNFHRSRSSLRARWFGRKFRMKQAQEYIDRKAYNKAVLIYAKAANAGDAQASFLLGKSYMEGMGIIPSIPQAVFWLEKAATSGHVAAQTLLATLYLRGVSESHLFGSEIKPNFSKARQWAERACSQNDADAMALMGYIYIHGDDKSSEKSLDFYKRSYEMGSSQGALGYGIALLSEQKQLDVALKALEKASLEGQAMATHLLGMMYEGGVGVDKDIIKAYTFFEKAAQSRIRPSMARWGMALLSGEHVSKNPIEGESWLRRAALAGDMEAAAMVGNLYAQGGELPPNHAEAALWFKRSAQAGHAGSARVLGQMHLVGVGVPKDLEEAAHWFHHAALGGDSLARKILTEIVQQMDIEGDVACTVRRWYQEDAENGDLVAAFNLGVCYIKGLGGDKNDQSARHWLRKAADGVVNAQYWYGRMLLQDDPVEARMWITRAAQSQMGDAQWMLGEMFLKGIGGEQNHSLARDYYSMAAHAGHVGAMFALAALYGGGYDLQMDRKQARHWFEQAAIRNHPIAMRMLGIYLSRGFGGEIDLHSSRQWLEKAIGFGVQEAQKDLAFVDQMSAAPPDISS